MLYRLLKSVKKWVYEACEGIASAEDRFVESMFRKEKDESN